MIIGITGGTGCGKTTALEVIRELGGLVLDCDAIYHRLLETDKDLLLSIGTAFPGVVFDDTLDRKTLGQIVFSDPDALKKLNSITHSAVKAEVERLLLGAPQLAAIDAIGLFEGELNKLCKLTVAITAPKAQRIRRLMERDNITPEYAKARIDAQPSDKVFIDRCDYHLENAGTQEAFREKCLAFFRQLGIMKENCKGESL